MKKRSARAAKSSSPPAVKEEPTVKDVYRAFKRWKSKTAPSWHPVKKTRYIFWRMTNGLTITDALREIHWNPRDFWTLVDPDFIDEYRAAKILQSRAMADAVITIAEGRDAVSRKMRRSLEKRITVAIKRAKSNKALAAMVLRSVTESIANNHKDVIARNKLQIDSAKWHAAKSNPNEFGERASLGLSNFPFSGTGDGQTADAFSVVFVAPDGSEIPFDPKNVLADSPNPAATETDLKETA